MDGYNLSSLCSLCLANCILWGDCEAVWWRKTHTQELHDLHVIFRDKKHEGYCISHLSCSDGSFSGQGVSQGTVLLLCADSVGWTFQQHGSMGTEVGRKKARRSWTFSHIVFEVKEWRKNRSICFLRKALKFLCSGLKSKSLQLLAWERHHWMRFVQNTSAQGRKRAVWMCINTAVLQPMGRRLEGGKASGELPAPWEVSHPSSSRG